MKIEEDYPWLYGYDVNYRSNKATEPAWYRRGKWRRVSITLFSPQSNFNYAGWQGENYLHMLL